MYTINLWERRYLNEEHVFPWLSFSTIIPAIETDILEVLVDDVMIDVVVEVLLLVLLANEVEVLLLVPLANEVEPAIKHSSIVNICFVIFCLTCFWYVLVQKKRIKFTKRESICNRRRKSDYCRKGWYTRVRNERATFLVIDLTTAHFKKEGGWIFFE